MFDDMIAGMKSNKKLNHKATELFLRGRKLNILLLFISQSYFKVLNTTRLIVTHYIVMNISNKREPQQIASNHLSNIDFKNFTKSYKE